MRRQVVDIQYGFRLARRSESEIVDDIKSERIQRSEKIILIEINVLFSKRKAMFTKKQNSDLIYMI
jgi:hypothetical protein